MSPENDWRVWLYAIWTLAFLFWLLSLGVDK